MQLLINLVISLSLAELAVSQEPLDPILFPGVPPSVKVHKGMVHEQAKSVPAPIYE